MLKLKKNGILERITFERPEPYDVTDIAFHYLHDEVEFEDDITMRDFFLLVEKNLDVFGMIFGNWIDEYTNEALHKEPKLKEKTSPNDTLDYVRLQWKIRHDKKELNVPSMPEFDGFSIAVEDDKYYKKGEEIHWGMDFTPVNSYIDKPLKLVNTVIIYDETTNEETQYFTDSFTLYQVVLGIVWEISFLGGPADRDEKNKELEEMMKRIESGEEELIPMEDVFNRIKSNLGLDEDEEL